jgi:hypothetical protein
MAGNAARLPAAYKRRPRLEPTRSPLFDASLVNRIAFIGHADAIHEFAPGPESITPVEPLRCRLPIISKAISNTTKKNEPADAG